MSRKKNWPPRPHLHKTSGQDRVRIDGRDIYLGPHGSDEAKERYAKLIADLVAGQPVGKRQVPVNVITVSDVLAGWLVHSAKVHSKRGRQQELYRAAMRPLERLFGSTAAARFGALELRQLREAMVSGSWMTAKDREKPHRPATGGWGRVLTNKRIGSIKTIWRWAEEEGGLVPPGSWAALSVVSPLRRDRFSVEEKKQRRTTTMDEVRRVCKHLRPRLRAALLVQWWTGMRSGEVRIMRPCDIDTTGPVWVYRPARHKTDYLQHERLVMIGARAQAVLRPLLKTTDPERPLFPSRGCPIHKGRGRGEPLTATGYSQAIQTAALKAGLTGFHGYLCRHATRMRISRTASDETARAVLGQRSLDISLKYGELDADLAREAARKLG